MSFIVRRAQPDDMDFIIHLAGSEGWNPGLSDGRAFYEADPQGFFIGELNGEPVGSISAVSYGDFAFIGLFIVQKEHRGQIFGIQLGRVALEYLRGKNIGVDGVVKKISVYEKFGFKKYHRNIRYQFIGSDVPEGSTFLPPEMPF